MKPAYGDVCLLISFHLLESRFQARREVVVPALAHDERQARPVIDLLLVVHTDNIDSGQSSILQEIFQSDQLDGKDPTNLVRSSAFVATSN